MILLEENVQTMLNKYRAQIWSETVTAKDKNTMKFEKHICSWTKPFV